MLVLALQAACSPTTKGLVRIHLPATLLCKNVYLTPILFYDTCFLMQNGNNSLYNIGHRCCKNDRKFVTLARQNSCFGLFGRAVVGKWLIA